jgi:hypothetical protein
VFCVACKKTLVAVAPLSHSHSVRLSTVQAQETFGGSGPARSHAASSAASREGSFVAEQVAAGAADGGGVGETPRGPPR